MLFAAKTNLSLMFVALSHTRPMVKHRIIIAFYTRSGPALVFVYQTSYKHLLNMVSACQKYWLLLMDLFLQSKRSDEFPFNSLIHYCLYPICVIAYTMGILVVLLWIYTGFSIHVLQEKLTQRHHVYSGICLQRHKPSESTPNLFSFGTLNPPLLPILLLSTSSHL